MTPTNLRASAAHSSSVLSGALHSSVSTGTSVLSEAQVVVGAHVDDVLHHFARMSAKDRQKPQYQDMTVDLFLL